MSCSLTWCEDDFCQEKNHERDGCAGPVIPASREALKLYRKHDLNHDYGVDQSEYNAGCQNDPRLLAILTPGSVWSACVHV